MPLGALRAHSPTAQRRPIGPLSPLAESLGEQNVDLGFGCPNLAAYIARGEARPAYKRAFEAQLAVNTGQPSSPS
jgi:hypothetical protein